MTQQHIDFGTGALNDGEQISTAFPKIEDNFDELFSLIDNSGLAVTWNNAGTVFTGLKLNITNTASHTNSRLIDLQIGGVSRLRQYKSGRFWIGEDDNTGDLIVGTSGSNVGLFTDGLHFGAGGCIVWGTGGAHSQELDTYIYRDAAGIVALRNGVNAETIRGYRTYTDASNYERWALQSGAGYFELAAETAGTGTDDIDLRLTPAGAGNMQFGTHSAIGAETVTGFITIKDAAGNSRKLAVVSS